MIQRVPAAERPGAEMRGLRDLAQALTANCHFPRGTDADLANNVAHETVSGITSLARERAGANALLGLTRGHWGIENGLHSLRDGTLREDASRIRKGAATQTTAVLRNIAIFLFDRSGHKSDAAATRHCVCHPEKSLEILSTPK
jgi:predicted transposase YbfD/YdcC